MNIHKEYVSAENALVVTFLTAGLYGFVEAGSFSSAAATFPRLVSGIVLVLGVLILFRGLLPENVESMIFQEASFGQSTGDDLPMNDTEDSTSTEHASAEDDSVSLDRSGLRGLLTDNRVVITVLGFVYMVLGYLIGLLWATPIFMVAYMLYKRKPWYITAAMVLVGTGIMFGFQWGIGLELDQGVLL